MRAPLPNWRKSCPFSAPSLHGLLDIHEIQTSYPKSVKRQFPTRHTRPWHPTAVTFPSLAPRQRLRTPQATPRLGATLRVTATVLSDKSEEDDKQEKDDDGDENSAEAESSSSDSDDAEVPDSGGKNDNGRATKDTGGNKKKPKKLSRVLKISVMALIDKDAGKRGNSKTSGSKTLVPVSLQIPPSKSRLSFGSNSESRLVGIVATNEHVRSGAYLQNGYGGMEALVQMKSLGGGELARLYDFFNEEDDIHDFVLTPRENQLSDTCAR